MTWKIGLLPQNFASFAPQPFTKSHVISLSQIDRSIRCAISPWLLVNILLVKFNKFCLGTYGDCYMVTNTWIQIWDLTTALSCRLLNLMMCHNSFTSCWLNGRRMLIKQYLKSADQKSNFSKRKSLRTRLVVNLNGKIELKYWMLSPFSAYLIGW